MRMPDESDALFRERLLQEVEDWRRSGLIGDRPYRRILERYDASSRAAVPDLRVGRLSTILAILGGLLVGIGVILLVASNWAGIPRLLKVAVMVAALLIAQTAAYRARFRRDGGVLAVSMQLLASLVYGASIFLIGQAYHVPVGDPRLLLMWGLGSAAMAYATGGRGPLLIGLLALNGWMLEVAGQPTGSFSLTVTTVLVFGVALLAIGEVHRSFDRVSWLGGTYALTGLVLTFIAAWLLSFSFAWDVFPAADRLPVPFLVACALGIAGLAAAALRWRRSRPMLVEAAGAFAILAAAVVAAAAAPTSVEVYGPQDGGRFQPVLFNLVLAGGALWAIVVGLATDRDAFVNTALVFLGLLILARYFDFSFGLFDRSVVFIGAGAVLLVTALALDRLRRRLTAPDHTAPEVRP